MAELALVADVVAEVEVVAHPFKVRKFRTGRKKSGTGIRTERQIRKHSHNKLTLVSSAQAPSSNQ